jgi:hypothetical protein
MEPGDVPLDGEFGYMYKALAQAWDAAGQSTVANRCLDLALALLNRIGRSGDGGCEHQGLGAQPAREHLLPARRHRGGHPQLSRRVDLTSGYGYTWHDLLGALALRAKHGGEVDVPAMERALERVKATGAGQPLWTAHMAQLEAIVSY